MPLLARHQSDSQPPTMFRKRKSTEPEHGLPRWQGLERPHRQLTSRRHRPLCVHESEPQDFQSRPI